MTRMWMAVLVVLVPAVAWGSQLTFRSSLGQPGNVVLRDNGAAQVVVPSIGGGTSVFAEGGPIAGVVPGIGAGLSGARPPTRTAVPVGGGVLLESGGWQVAGTGFCLPPCQPTPDGLFPDGAVVAGSP